MDTHRALIAMGGVRARLLDHGQRVRFALKMGLWGPKWPRASAARADEKNVPMHLCSFGRFLPVLSPTFAFATSTALVPWICQGVPFLMSVARAAIGPSLGLELIGLPSFGLEVCVWEGGAHEVQSKGLEASERALA